MSIFGKIWESIAHHGPAKAATPPVTPTSAPAAPAQQQDPSPAQTTANAPATATDTVDVGAVLSEMASMKGGGGNYRTSIVDLLKLLDLNSSLEARKELADELNVHAGDPGTAEQNIALHRAVMDKVAANGGVVPDDMRT